MTVEKLIIELQKIAKERPGAKVWHIWDGEPRTSISVVYLSKDNRIITSDFGEVVYSTNARPKNAPTEDENPYWSTPRKHKTI